jgi:putative ABC transport system ATP-binding protein
VSADTIEAPLGATAERQAVLASTGAAPGKDWIIVTRGIRREYDMGGEIVRALRGVDLAIQRNEYVAIMGPSGSGKSTLMNVIGCLDTPNEGEYWLNGTQVSSMSDDELARVRNREIERVQLGSRMDHRPNELSGGQRQRVAIARALVNNPSILLADEPTGNLDSTTSEEIMRVFASLADQGQTVIMVTHEPDIAQHARRVVVLRDGLIASDERRSAFVEKLGATA